MREELMQVKDDAGFDKGKSNAEDDEGEVSESFLVHIDE